MAEKEISNLIKLQIEAGKATPAPPVGPALGGSGVNIMQFVKEFNDRTANQAGFIIPVVITVYKDKSFSLFNNALAIVDLPVPLIANLIFKLPCSIVINASLILLQFLITTLLI